MMLSRCLMVAVISFWCCVDAPLVTTEEKLIRPLPKTEAEEMVENICKNPNIKPVVECLEDNRPGMPFPFQVRETKNAIVLFAELSPSPLVKITRREEGSEKTKEKEVMEKIQVVIKRYKRGDEDARKTLYEEEMKGVDDLAAFGLGPYGFNLVSEKTNEPFLEKYLLIVMRVDGPTGWEVFDYVLQPAVDHTQVQLYICKLQVLITQLALLHSVARLHQKGYRHCDAHMENMIFAPPSDADLAPYRSQMDGKFKDAEEFIEFKSKIVFWPSLNGTKVPILIDAKKVIFIDPPHMVKVEDEAKAYCKIPPVQRSDVFLASMVDWFGLEKKAQLLHFEGLLADIKEAFATVKSLVWGKKDIPARDEASYLNYAVKVLSKSKAAIESEALDAIRLSGDYH